MSKDGTNITATGPETTKTERFTTSLVPDVSLRKFREKIIKYNVVTFLKKQTLEYTFFCTVL